MNKAQKTAFTQVKVMEDDASKTKDDHQDKVKNICPECSNQVFFLEAGFLCPTCGYSVETIFS